MPQTVEGGRERSSEQDAKFRVASFSAGNLHRFRDGDGPSAALSGIKDLRSFLKLSILFKLNSFPA